MTGTDLFDVNDSTVFQDLAGKAIDRQTQSMAKPFTGTAPPRQQGACIQAKLEKCKAPELLAAAKRVGVVAKGKPTKPQTIERLVGFGNEAAVC